jgi:hypothetical protein
MITLVLFGVFSENVSEKEITDSTYHFIPSKTSSVLCSTGLNAVYGGHTGDGEVVPTIPVSEGSSEMITFGELLTALEQVESGGNPDAIGDDGLAFGSLQIHYETVLFVNRIYGFQYRHTDCFDPSISRNIAIHYLRYWGEQYEKKASKTPSAETYCRIWNGGGLGWQVESTIPHWNKVKECLK